MDTQFLLGLIDYNARPVIIDRVNDNLVYYGYCLPNCKSGEDDKWLIQMWQKNGTIEQIAYPNGLREYTQAWNRRAELNYKLTPNLDMF